MSILIKGMEMPKSCGNCFFDSHCDNWRIRNWGAPPPDDCPLVPVPPHGRLIDADALIDDMANMIPWAIESPEEIAMVDGLSEGYEAVKAAPTILEAEEGK